MLLAYSVDNLMFAGWFRVLSLRSLDVVIRNSYEQRWGVLSYSISLGSRANLTHRFKGNRTESL